MPRDDSIQHIRRRLARLRWSVRATMLSNGLNVLIGTSVGCMALSLILDYFAHMDLAQRAVLLVLGIICLAWIVYKRILRPVVQSLPDDALAARIESRHSELADRLINAVQFAEKHDATAGASKAMINRSIESGIKAVEGFDWNRLIDKRRRNWHFLIGIFSVGILLCGIAFLPTTMTFWFKRNVLLEKVQWPRATTLMVMEANENSFTVPEGDDLAVEIMAHPGGIVPREVVVQTRTMDSTTNMRSIAQTDDNMYRMVFKDVDSPLSFRATGNDHTTEWFQITPLPRPTISHLKLTLSPPKYTDRSEQVLPPGRSAYKFVQGSSLAIDGEASTHLQEVQVGRNKDLVKTIDIEESKRFQTSITPANLKEGNYHLLLLDTNGVENRRSTSFILNLQPDQKPDVKAKLEGLGNMAVAEAVAPLGIVIEDDFGISDAKIAVKIPQTENQTKTQILPIPSLKEQFQQQSRNINTKTELEMTELGVSNGDNVSIRIRAEDNDAISGPKTGSSPPISIRIVTEDKLRSVLHTREQTLHQQFRRMLEDQRNLLERTRIFTSQLGQTDISTEDNSQNLSELQRSQHKMRRRGLDVAEQFISIVAQIQNNRLEASDGPYQSRLIQKIIRPVTNLADEMNPKATQKFKKALATVNQPSSCRKTLQEALDIQKEIIRRMEMIQDNMARSETIQQAVKILRDILQQQQRLRQKTQQQQEETEENIFSD